MKINKNIIVVISTIFIAFILVALYIHIDRNVFFYHTRSLILTLKPKVIEHKILANEIVTNEEYRKYFTPYTIIIDSICFNFNQASNIATCNNLEEYKSKYPILKKLNIYALWQADGAQDIKIIEYINDDSFKKYQISK